MRRPSESERARTADATPAATRDASNESASRVNCARVVASPSRSSESSTTRSAVTATMVASTSAERAARGNDGTPRSAPSNERMVGCPAASPPYRAVAAYAVSRDATGGDSRSTRIAPYNACTHADTSRGSVSAGRSQPTSAPSAEMRASIETH